jgi:Porin subfamily
MRVRVRGIFATSRPLMTVVAVTIFATVILRPSAPAAAVEYVRICTLYGAGFYYLPGTDTCVNFATNDARVSTAGGVWRWRIPNSPRTLEPTPQDACEDGKLVKFGDITGADLTQNAYSRYETNTHLPLMLKKGQYIASVIYKGGLTTTESLVSQLPACPSSNTFVSDATDTACTQGNAPAGGGGALCEVACVSGAWEFTGHNSGVLAGNFCMYYHYTDAQNLPVYFPIGCLDTAWQAASPSTSVFTPDLLVPPATANQIDILGANGPLWGITTSAEVQGPLSVWLCLEKGR